MNEEERLNILCHECSAQLILLILRGVKIIILIWSQITGKNDFRKMAASICY